MILNRRTLSLVALACGLAACSESTAPDDPDATVTVQAPSVAVTTVAAGEVTWIDFTIPLRIENTGSTSLTFVYCASRIEARAADGWSKAWSPVCLVESTLPVQIPPGAHLETSMTVRAAIGGPGGPTWSPGTTDGSYRFVAGLLPDGAGGIVPTVSSNSFTLVSVE